MAVNTRSTLLSAAGAVVLATLGLSAAHATDGYLQEGVSPADQATGGAGVAEGRDALTLGNNPAGLYGRRPAVQRRSDTVRTLARL